MRTKTKVILVLNIFAICLGAFFLIQQLFFEESPDQKLIIQSAVIFCTYSFGVSRFFYQIYKVKHQLFLNKYAPFFEGAFINAKKSLSSIHTVAKYLEEEKYNKAYDLIESLKKNCASVADTCSVLLLEVLCLNGKQNYNAALSVSKKVLELAPYNSNAWALSALLHHRLGFSSQGLSHAEHAVELSPENPIVQTYKALLHLRRNEYEAAETHATNAFHLNSALDISFLILIQAHCSLVEIELSIEFLKPVIKSRNIVEKRKRELNILLS